MNKTIPSSNYKERENRENMSFWFYFVCGSGHETHESLSEDEEQGRNEGKIPEWL